MLALSACGGDQGGDRSVSPTTSEMSLMASLPLSWCLTGTPVARAEERADELVESGELTRSEANTALGVYRSMARGGNCG